MTKKYKKLIALVAASFAFVLVAAGLHSSNASAEVYYGGNYIILSTYYVAPGQNFTVSGYRFYPGEQVTVQAGSMTQTATADGAGHFSSNFTVPYSLSGSESRLVVSAHGSTSNMTRTAELIVAGFYPTVMPSSYFVSQGSTIMISGSGFSANELITVTLNGNPYGSFRANGNGTFTNMTLTTATSSTDQTYVFTGTQSGARVQVTIHTFSWSNQWQGWITNPLMSSVVTNTSGSAAVTVTTSATTTTPTPPAMPTIPATTTQATSTTATTSSSSLISVSESSARFGDWISITGQGYQPNEPITIHWNDQMLTTAQAGATGGFYVAMPVPEGASGLITIRAQGSQTHDNSIATFTRI